jgi:hypothetical protein
MGKYLCSRMLSAHCSICCVGMCGKRNFIEESMASAKLMAGCAWPSADATRWAIESVVLKMYGYLSKKIPKKLLGELGDIAGIQGIRPDQHGYKEKRA